MSGEPPSKMSDTWSSKNRLALWLVIALVTTNLVALYTFGLHARPSISQGEASDLAYHRDPLVFRLNETLDTLLVTQRELLRVRHELSQSLERLNQVHSNSDDSVKGGTCECFISRKEDYPAAEEFHKYTSAQELPLGFSPLLKTDSLISPVGHSCLLHKVDLEQYMSYKPGARCPDDEELAQKLMTGGCEPLPRRRCFAQTPTNYTEPLPVPKCFWTSPPDGNILWTAYPCKSFECLNNRKKNKVFADCLDCFDLEGREKTRWAGASGVLDLSIDEVLSVKSGSIRIGLDIGGGTGSFAVRMRERGVTIVTTTLNFAGPFNNFIASRGVVPLHLTVSQRFPFFDNTLDIVHSMHVLSNWIPNDTLEFILFDIDRILRPGGIFWLDRFFCIEHQLNETYIPMVEKLGYKKLRWTVGAKLDRGPELMERYLTAVLEKPLKRS